MSDSPDFTRVINRSVIRTLSGAQALIDAAKIASILSILVGIGSITSIFDFSLVYGGPVEALPHRAVVGKDEPFVEEFR